jgi:hypothetical protein
MASFLGKTISSGESTRIRNAHKNRIIGVESGATPTLAQVEAHYWQTADNQVVYTERETAQAALSDPSPIGIKDK